MLSLAVCLWVETRRQTDLGPKFSTELLQYPGSELGSAVEDSLLGCHRAGKHGPWGVWQRVTWARPQKWAALETQPTIVMITVLPEEGGNPVKNSSAYDHGRPGMGGVLSRTGGGEEVLFWAQMEQAETYSWTFWLGMATKTGFAKLWLCVLSRLTGKLAVVPSVLT